MVSWAYSGMPFSHERTTEQPQGCISLVMLGWTKEVRGKKGCIVSIYRSSDISKIKWYILKDSLPNQSLHGPVRGIWIVSSTVGPQCQPVCPRPLGPVLGMVAARSSRSSLPAGEGFGTYRTVHGMWLRTFSTALEEELTVPHLAKWLNCHHFDLFGCFAFTSAFSHFSKFIPWLQFFCRQKAEGHAAGMGWGVPVLGRPHRALTWSVSGISATNHHTKNFLNIWQQQYIKMAWNDQRNTSKKKKKKDQAISHGDCNDLVTSPLWKHHFSSSFQRKLIDGFWYFLPAPTILFSFFKVLATHCHWVVLPVHGSILELPGANKWKAGSRWLVFTHMNKTFKIFSLLYWCIKKHKHQRRKWLSLERTKASLQLWKKTKPAN